MKTKLFLLVCLLFPMTGVGDIVTLKCDVNGIRWFPDSEYGLGDMGWKTLAFDLDKKRRQSTLSIVPKLER